ncbi:MAG: hypothetical protein KDK35_12170 [Leptospiraceae bacterium]|nr:hypothetical protein [Leptospiraceae bacterium]
MCKPRKQLLSGALLILFALALLGGPASHAAPPRPSMSEQVAGASVILVGRISAVRVVPFNSIARSASMHVTVQEVLKGQSETEFNLAFLVFPGTFENHLRQPVSPGQYVLFLNDRAVRSRGGENGRALMPAEPRAFSFQPYSESLVEQIQSTLNGPSGDEP